MNLVAEAAGFNQPVPLASASIWLRTAPTLQCGNQWMCTGKNVSPRSSVSMPSRIQSDSLLEQTPLSPAFRASSHNCADQNTVTIRINASGHFKRIKREAFSPSISGILKSINVTCASWECFFTASLPLTASQQTTQS
jgi:hypothetical protein